MKSFIKPLLCLLFSYSFNVYAQFENLETFPLRQVKLTEGVFKNAEQTCLNYILDMDADRLLAPYLRESGLQQKSESYGNWENSGLDGHIGGHYLSALAIMYAATGDKEIEERLTYYLSELKRCQDANQNGYLGGVPGSKNLWKEISDGKIDAATFSLNKKWVPLYNIHKVFAGLHDAWQYTGNTTAKDMFLKLCDWGLATFGKLNEQQMQQMLKSEHGGLNESFADAYQLTGQKKYLDMAQKFSHRAILDPLLKQEDKLTGLHANTQIPKVIGYEKISMLSNKPDWHKASNFFWDNIVYKRTVAIGGNSVREHFHPTNNFMPMIEDIEGPETCNTYNMLKLSKALYQQSGDIKYIDYIEKALYNHILSSQHPEKGGFVYFTPMRPNHYRVYSQPETSMWCCVGSGLENHGKYGEFIFAHNAKDLFVNLFIPAELSWQEKGVKISQNTHFPENNIVSLKIHEVKNGNFSFYIRVPHWTTADQMKITVNGKLLAYKPAKEHYIQLSRKWKKGDEISINLSPTTRIEQIADNLNYVSLFYGPILLAAKTDTTDLKGLFADESRGGHIAHGKQIPLHTAPQFIVNSSDDILTNLTKNTGKIAFSSADIKFRKALEFIPFYDVHDTRYSIYFKYINKERYELEDKEARAKEAAETARKEKTVDMVYAGQQQPENDHFFKGENTESGIHRDKHWRHSRSWFSYQLKNEKQRGKKIVITCYGADNGRNFDVLVNNTVIGTVNLTGDKGNTFFDLEFNIPEELNRDILEVKFVAKKGSIAGGIYEVKLME